MSASSPHISLRVHVWASATVRVLPRPTVTYIAVRLSVSVMTLQRAGVLYVHKKVKHTRAFN
jgi:hypothetical protein